MEVFVVFMLCRPQPMETVVRNRTSPWLPFRASTTGCWPHSFRKQIRLKTVRVCQPFKSTQGETHDIAGLYANVFRPTGVTKQSNLPVVVVSTRVIQNNAPVSSNWSLQWFYGGAFGIGDASSYDGSTLVHRSVELGKPVIYVNFNYRVNAFGWLAGKEALAGGAANVGLHDREYRFDC